MIIRAIVLALFLACVASFVNDARGSVVENTYQKVKTYYSMVVPKEQGCANAIPYLKGSTIVDKGNGNFLVIVSFICGREA